MFLEAIERDQWNQIGPCIKVNGFWRLTSLTRLYEKTLLHGFFWKNDIPYSWTLALVVKNSNSSNNKSTRGTRHGNHEAWYVYEHVRLETPEASEGWGAQEQVGHKAQAGREHTRHKVR